MFGFFNNGANPIGLDIGNDVIKMVQLKENGKGVFLHAGGSESRPEAVEPGSGNWQRWAIDAIHKVLNESKFSGKDAIASLPADDIFIDHIKVNKVGDIPNDKLNELILPKIKQKLPFEASDAIIKYVPAQDDNIIIIATERKKVEVHLAIYERTPLAVKSIAVWPLALVNCYVKFFGRRKSDLDSVVMLVDVGPKNTNVAISRHINLLFARSLSLGPDMLNEEAMTTQLALELNACRRYFGSMYRSGKIDRLLFLSGNSVNKDNFAKIAKQMELPAQTGDCLTAAKIEEPWNCKIERRESRESWAATFGLSLSREV